MAKQNNNVESFTDSFCRKTAKKFGISFEETKQLYCECVGRDMLGDFYAFMDVLRTRKDFLWY